MPPISWFIFWAMAFTFRLLDRGFSSNKRNTKKVTIQAYVNLYSGPEYLIHYKYSSMLNVTFVAFTYGIGLPLIFPIAFFVLVILFILERLLLTYYYREPPTFDEKLNDSALTLLRWAPLFMFSVGYWMLSNQQIFGNNIPHNDLARPF